MNSENSAVHLLVHGRVQGVWYRGSTQAEAKKMGLKGWVRNLPDGTVEIQAEGDRNILITFIEWCRQGPPAAEVVKVEEKWIEAEGFDSFQIR